MKKLKVSEMNVVNDYSIKNGCKGGACGSGNCYECNSGDCDGGMCDCTDGDY